MVTILDVSYTVFVMAAEYNRVYYYLKHWNGAPDGYVMGCGDPDIVYRSEITKEPELTDFSTNLIPISTLVENEDDVVAVPTIAVLLLKQEFDIQDTVMYIGTAAIGTLVSELGWTIKKFVLVNGNVTQIMVTEKNSAIWDNRATETYL